MDFQMKDTVVNSLIRVVENAPKIAYYSNGDITDKDFLTWRSYVNAVLDISYEYTKLVEFLQYKQTIENISSNNTLPFIRRVYEINDVILNLAKMLLQR